MYNVYKMFQSVSMYLDELIFVALVSVAVEMSIMTP